MTITIEQNVSHGQLYLVADDGDEIRIPTTNVDGFLHASGIEDDYPLTYGGDLAQSIWIVAQNFGHEV